MAKEHVYIKDGVILRGNEATEELARKDAEEIIKESGLGFHVEKKSVTLRLRKPNVTSTAKTCKTDSMSATATGVSVSADLARGEATAHGVKGKALNASGEGLSLKGTLRAFAEVAGAQMKAATLEGQALGFDFRGEVGTSVKAVDLKSLNPSVTGVRAGMHVSSTATAKLLDAKVANANITAVKTAAEAEASAAAKLVDVKLANADTTGLDTAAKAGATATAKGADIKAANIRVAGAEVTAKAEAKAEATLLDVNAANAKVVGYKKHSGVGASAQAKGLEAKVATANITGVEKKKEITAEVKAVGKKVEAANVKMVGKKSGASAQAKVEAQGAKLQVANINVEGKDSSISASANLHAAAASAQVANVNITPHDGAHFHATADISPGIDAFNVQVGTHKGTGIGVSTKLQVGNVYLSAGPPNLHFGPGLNLGFGGSSSKNGKQSGGGGHREGSSYTTEGRHKLRDAKGRQTQCGTSITQQASAGEGEHSINRQGPIPGNAQSGGHNSRQVAKNNVVPVHGGYGIDKETDGGGSNSSNNECIANSSGHIASSTEHKASGSGHYNTSRKYYSSSTGHGFSTRGHGTRAAGQGDRSSGSEPSNGKGTTRDATRMNQFMATGSSGSSDGHTTPTGHHDATYFAKDNGHVTGGTGYKTNGSGCWTTDGEHDDSGSGYVMKTNGQMTHGKKQGTRISGLENSSGDHDNSRFGPATKGNGHIGGSTSWKSGINGEGTAGMEHSVGNIGHVIKRGGHVASSARHTPSHMSGGGMKYKTWSSGHEATGADFDISRRGQVARSGGHRPTSTEHKSGHKKQSSGPMIGSTEYSTGHVAKSRLSTEFKSQGIGQRTTVERNDVSSTTKRRDDGTKQKHIISGDEKTSGGNIASDAAQVMQTSGLTASSKFVPVVKLSASRNEQMTSKPASEEEADIAMRRKPSRNPSPHLRQSSGFASTYRRNDSDHKPITPNESTGLEVGPTKGSITSVPDHDWKKPCSDGKKDERPERKRTTDYRDMLASQVGRHVQSLQLPESNEKKESERKELPSSRQEAKQELIRRLRKAHQQNALDTKTTKDDSEASGTATGGKDGDAGSKAQGTSAKGTSAGDDDTIPKPKEKPFGSSKNIFTLGCFQNESSRKVKILSGRVHGFEA